MGEDASDYELVGVSIRAKSKRGKGKATLIVGQDQQAKRVDKVGGDLFSKSQRLGLTIQFIGTLVVLKVSLTSVGNCALTATLKFEKSTFIWPLELKEFAFLWAESFLRVK